MFFPSCVLGNVLLPCVKFSNLLTSTVDMRSAALRCKRFEGIAKKNFKASRLWTQLWRTKNQPKVFQTEVFHGGPHGMSVSKCLFSQDFEGLTEVFGRMSAGISGQKLSLWAEFSFLKLVVDISIKRLVSRRPSSSSSHTGAPHTPGHISIPESVQTPAPPTLGGPS